MSFQIRFRIFIILVALGIGSGPSSTQASFEDDLDSPRLTKKQGLGILSELHADVARYEKQDVESTVQFRIQLLNPRPNPVESGCKEEMDERLNPSDSDWPLFTRNLFQDQGNSTTRSLKDLPLSDIKGTIFFRRGMKGGNVVLKSPFPSQTGTVSLKGKQVYLNVADKIQDSRNVTDFGRIHGYLGNAKGTTDKNEGIATFTGGIQVFADLDSNVEKYPCTAYVSLHAAYIFLEGALPVALFPPEKSPGKQPEGTGVQQPPAGPTGGPAQGPVAEGPKPKGPEGKEQAPKAAETGKEGAAPKPTEKEPGTGQKTPGPKGKGKAPAAPGPQPGADEAGKGKETAEGTGQAERPTVPPPRPVRIPPPPLPPSGGGVSPAAATGTQEQPQPEAQKTLDAEKQKQEADRLREQQENEDKLKQEKAETERVRKQLEQARNRPTRRRRAAPSVAAVSQQQPIKRENSGGCQATGPISGSFTPLLMALLFLTCERKKNFTSNLFRRGGCRP